MVHSVELAIADYLHLEHLQLCKDRGTQVLHDRIIATAGRGIFTQSGHR
jgi:hypothetical protein